TDEIRCLTECEIFTLTEKLTGECKYMEFRYKNKGWNFAFADGKHHHYHCCLSKKSTVKNKICATKSFADLEKLNVLIRKEYINTDGKEELIVLQKKLKSKYSFIKTHSIFYSELLTLYEMNIGDIENTIGIEEDNDNS
ncbi:MAG: hypothetical protein Q7U68_04115, partial [Candidatus Roizmanbacteria bacterium]|nr:hypothetical protein [Candidatus Roizmanbacteria bacterium]